MGTINKIPVSFIAIQHFPHPIVNNYKRVHRLVVLPDYQGIGLGNKLLEFIGNIYIQKKYRYIINTSNTALINYFQKSKKWKLKMFGKQMHNETLIYKQNSLTGRIMTSWEYI